MVRSVIGFVMDYYFVLLIIVNDYMKYNLLMLLPIFYKLVMLIKTEQDYLIIFNLYAYT